jgi:hypothetical protein
VEIRKSAMTAVPGAGIGVGVCTQKKGCGWRPNRVDQAIAIPGNTATSATKYCARNSLAIPLDRKAIEAAMGESWLVRFLKFGKPSRSFNCYARTAKAKRAA